MLRQNPIQKKRGRMNLKRRLAPLKSAEESRQEGRPVEPSDSGEPMAADETVMEKSVAEPVVSSTEQSGSLAQAEPSTESLSDRSVELSSEKNQTILPNPPEIQSTTLSSSVFSSEPVFVSSGTVASFSMIPQPVAEMTEAAVQPDSSPVSDSMDSGGRSGNKLESRKSECDEIPSIVTSMLAGASDNELLRLVRDGLEQAERRNDSFSAAVFRGAVAAFQVPMALIRAVEWFQKALKLSDGVRDPAGGFLHMMLWELFVRSGGAPEAAQLLDQARQEFQISSQRQGDRDESRRRALEELETIDGFKTVWEAFQKHEDRETHRLRQRVMRESRFARDANLLLFPGAIADFGNDDPVAFRTSAAAKGGGCYFVRFHGIGTVLNPDRLFWDGFYRLGGSAVDVQNIVFSSVSSLDPSWFDQAVSVISLRGAADRLRMIVSSDVANRFEEELARLETKGPFDVVRLQDRCGRVFSACETELAGGGLVTLDSGMITLKHSDGPGRGSTLQFIDSFELPFRSAPPVSADQLLDEADVLVVAADRPDGIFQTLAAIREKRPRLVVLDVPQHKVFDWTSLTVPLRSYLEKGSGGETPIAFVDASLVCDPRHHRFLDIVKAFRSPDADCWSDFGALAFSGTRLDRSGDSGQGLYYFAADLETEFQQDAVDIVDSFQTDRRRRRGLYFA